MMIPHASVIKFQMWINPRSKIVVLMEIKAAQPLHTARTVLTTRQQLVSTQVKIQ
jgi:hypothetical protein